ncbi:STAS domain-containing protein [Actinoplanes sp. G11-F43]|uniref:STAS domain-containing protein n=1 Tax=Actinoplanes sp. G11-F43 TaxID=3424130 RepID=UPI003D34B342
MIRPFSIEKQQGCGGVVRLAVTGELDEDVSDTLSAIIANAAGQPGVTQLNIDLAQVSFVAAAGVRSLLRGAVEARRLGRGYRLINTSTAVERVLRISGAAALISVAEPVRS